MKLGDMYLSDLEGRALRRLLAQHITRADRDEKEAAEAEEEAQHNAWYETLTRLARETAQQDGLTTFAGWRQAEGAWDAFEASEGWHSPLDVDEYFQCDADWKESWCLAYADELEKMKRETAE